ncbi:MAG TPA: ABC transporter ATP-binding protein [Xanthobacteraceae bacterium]|nr:ABC transporter ATP-binding protein [Xanthobacteraceae bacterium]
MIASAEIDVSLAGVEKRYGHVVALPGLDLAVERGSFFALLGPSGCGKTTTLRVVAGFETVARGEVYIRGERVTQRPPHRRNFGMVFQQLALFPHLNVADNVAFGLRMRNVAGAAIRARAREALGLVKLAGLEARYPRELSGGQQQRVALARAIVFEPAVLLLDEPLAALDRNLRQEMQAELRQLQRRLGLTTIFVTHDQEEALTMADVVAVMNEGRIEQLGSPREVYERPRTRFVAGFLGANNFLTARVVGSIGGLLRVEAFGAVLRVAGRPRKDGETVTLALRPERIRLAPPGAGRFTARVTDIVFRGPDTHVRLERDLADFQVILQNSGLGAAPVHPDDMLDLDFAEESLVLLD